MKITKCSPADYETLVGIWERSVRASHDFLPEDTIMEIKAALVPAYFPAVDIYAVEDSNVFAGFIGLSGDMIEMLFIDSDCRGRGLGSELIGFARRRGALRVDVNEQNHYALEFYKAKGFRIIGREDTDDAGRPYPILHMSL